MASASVIHQIAESLGESDARALAQIAQIAEALGDDGVLGLLAHTERAEHDGGMMLMDGSRRRTPGGVFFRLARPRLSREQRRRIFAFASAPADAAEANAIPTVSGPPSGRRAGLTSVTRRATESAMPDTAQLIRAKVDAFVADISGLVQADVLRMIGEALGGRLPATAQSRAGRVVNVSRDIGRAVRSRAVPSRKAGERRSTEAMASAVSAVAAFITANPRTRAEQIAKGLGTTSKELALPIKKLLADGAIKSKGQKRGTKYWSA